MVWGVGDLELRTLVCRRSDNGCVSYANMKQAAQGFCDARRQFENTVANAKLGYWLRKPLEQNRFEKTLPMLRAALLRLNHLIRIKESQVSPNKKT